MIPFDEIDQRLKALGKDRAWLSEESGRKPDSVRVALAPNALAAKRSELLQKALSDAIEREESSRAAKADLPSRLAVQPANEEEFRAWCRAYKASAHDTLEDWAIASLNDAAAQWLASGKAPLAALPPASSPTAAASVPARA